MAVALSTIWIVPAEPPRVSPDPLVSEATVVVEVRRLRICRRAV